MKIKSTILSGFVTLLTLFIFLPSQTLGCGGTTASPARRNNRLRKRSCHPHGQRTRDRQSNGHR